MGECWKWKSVGGGRVLFVGVRVLSFELMVSALSG